MILIDEDENSSKMNNINHNSSKNDIDRLIIERYVVGSSTFIFSFTTFLLYVLCLKIIAKLRRRSSFYKLAFQIGLSDVGQLFLNGVATSAFLIFCAGGENPMPIFVQRLAGGLMGVFWFSNGFLVHCLAFNRFLNVYFLVKGRKVFTGRNTNIVIVFAWLQGLVWLMLYMLPDARFMYNMRFYTYVYGSSAASYRNSTINFWVNIFHMSGLLLWHFLILIKIRRTPRLLLQETSHVNPNVARRRRERTIKALMQCLLLCSLYMATIVTFHLVQWTPVHRFWSLAANSIWMLCSGANVLVYVTLNR
uniref:Uncharacterized protein n=1 Tax=Romanomermis culicivorax TaxID=13658 RepID=A0A915JNN3_ROMCU